MHHATSLNGNECPKSSALQRKRCYVPWCGRLAKDTNINDGMGPRADRIRDREGHARSIHSAPQRGVTVPSTLCECHGDGQINAYRRGHLVHSHTLPS